jgi:flagella basal body P-ring formation protein FlgA
MQAIWGYALSVLATAATPANGSGPRMEPASAEQREVWVAARRLNKGVAASCADFRLERLAVRRVPARALTLPCDVPPGTVALREIAEGDVIRRHDVGIAPEVMAGSTVRVVVVAGAIRVTSVAVALTDARVGEQVPVRLDHPRRTVQARATGPGMVELEAVAQ